MRAEWRVRSRVFLPVLTAPGERKRWKGAGMVMAVLLLISAILLVGIALLTNWDIALADSAFDATTKAFPLRHAWLTETFNHVMLKRVFTVLGLGFVVSVLWDLLAPRRWSALRRVQMRVVALTALLVPTAISLLKLNSGSHCPWDLTRYGGTAPYVRMFESLPSGVTPGHCMPAGHASSALWLISLSIFFVPHHLTRAAVVLAALLCGGVGVGWMQQLRGAHFLTHTLWSAWVALVLFFLITLCLDRWPERPAPTS